MIAAGDVHIADVGNEIRRRVLVVSNERFHRQSSQVLIAPSLAFEADEVLDPWRIAAGEWVHALDLLASLPAHRLLDRVDRLTQGEIRTVQRALRSIT